ncbi:MAG: C-type lectin domain-containing protein [Proteobacteria bacterium]|nr:C-type lectin domain-containing protein [Pseudomonadota bacterium]
MPAIRLLLLLLLLLAGCADATLPGVDPVDDDDVAADDDDVAPDDDDVAPDDDDVADDDDAVEPVCPLETINCGDASSVTGTTVGGLDAFNNYSCVGGGNTGPEVGYAFTAPYDGEFTFVLSGLTEDLDLFALEGATCDPNECLDESWEDGVQDEEIEIDLEAGDQIIIMADGWDEAESSYSLTTSCSETGPDCVAGTYGGHTYELCSGDELGWVDSRNECTDQGGYLVTVNDADENAWLAAQLAAASVDVAWIGYNDRGGGNEGSFTWTAGNGSGYENWNAGEPNNQSNEDCVLLQVGTGDNWNDAPCGGDQAYICEWD